MHERSIKPSFGAQGLQEVWRLPASSGAVDPLACMAASSSILPAAGAHWQPACPQDAGIKLPSNTGVGPTELWLRLPVQPLDRCKTT